VIPRLRMMDAVDPLHVHVNLDPDNVNDLGISTWKDFGADI